MIRGTGLSQSCPETALAKRRCRGFSLLEALMGLAVLALLLLGVFRMNAQSLRAGADASVEFFAGQLAQEGVEIFHAFGYDWVSCYSEHPLPGFPLEWKPLMETPTKGEEYPAEGKQFQRRVVLSAVEEDQIRGIRVEVQVAPLPGTLAEKGLSRPLVTAETLVLELPR